MLCTKSLPSILFKSIATKFLFNNVIICSSLIKINNLILIFKKIFSFCSNRSTIIICILINFWLYIQKLCKQEEENYNNNIYNFNKFVAIKTKLYNYITTEY